jgi:hypothetical protein
MFRQSMTAVQLEKEVAKISPWQLNVDYVESCNCDYGCPCNFSGFPTYGFCRALVFHHVKKGNYGDVKLDGLNIIHALSWPKAIHEGDGTEQIYVSKEANQKQREAIEQIFYGRAKGNGYFAIFASTSKYFHPPQFVDIEYRIDGKRSWFSVPGILEVEQEPFKNPVTGEEADTRIVLPKGFIWQEAQACTTKKMRIVSPVMSFDDSGKNSFFCPDLEFKGP